MKAIQMPSKACASNTHFALRDEAITHYHIAIDYRFVSSYCDAAGNICSGRDSNIAFHRCRAPQADFADGMKTIAH